MLSLCSVIHKHHAYIHHHDHHRWTNCELLGCIGRPWIGECSLTKSFIKNQSSIYIYILKHIIEFNPNQILCHMLSHNLLWGLSLCFKILKWYTLFLHLHCIFSMGLASPTTSFSLHYSTHYKWNKPSYNPITVLFSSSSVCRIAINTIKMLISIMVKITKIEYFVDFHCSCFILYTGLLFLFSGRVFVGRECSPSDPGAPTASSTLWQKLLNLLEAEAAQEIWNFLTSRPSHHPHHL